MNLGTIPQLKNHESSIEFENLRRAKLRRARTGLKILRRGGDPMIGMSLGCSNVREREINFLGKPLRNSLSAPTKSGSTAHPGRRTEDFGFDVRVDFAFALAFVFVFPFFFFFFAMCREEDNTAFASFPHFPYRGSVQFCS